MDERVKEYFKRSVLADFERFLSTSGLPNTDEVLLEWLISRSLVPEKIVRYAMVINFVNADPNETKTERIKQLDVSYDIPESTSWHIVRHHSNRFRKTKK